MQDKTPPRENAERQPAQSDPLLPHPSEGDLSAEKTICPTCQHQGPDWFGLCSNCGSPVDEPSLLSDSAPKVEIQPPKERQNIPVQDDEFGALNASLDNLLSELLEIEIRERNDKELPPAAPLKQANKTAPARRPFRLPAIPGKFYHSLEWLLMSVLLVTLLVLGISAGLWLVLYFFQ